MQENVLLAIPRTPGILHGPHTSFPPSESIGLLPCMRLDATIPPVHRRYSNSEATNKYEENRPAIEMEITPLKAVAEPMLTSARTHAIRVVVATAYTGIDVRLLTYEICKCVVCHFQSVLLTLLRVRQPGKPRSREKAQKTRDEEASKPTVALTAKHNTKDDITAAPDVELVACLNIATNGYAGFSASAASMSLER